MTDNKDRFDVMSSKMPWLTAQVTVFRVKMVQKSDLTQNKIILKRICNLENPYQACFGDWTKTISSSK